MAEMPHLEAEIWQPLKNSGLTVLAIGRENNVDELKEFRKKLKLTMTFIPDEKKDIYQKYAKKIIPRNYVIDKSGKVIFVAKDYNLQEFAAMKKVIEQAVSAK